MASFDAKGQGKGKLSADDIIICHNEIECKLSGDEEFKLKIDRTQMNKYPTKKEVHANKMARGNYIQKKLALKINLLFLLIQRYL